MGLRWERPSSSRWVGYDDTGRQVGFVAEVVSDGGTGRYWFARRQDGTPTGVRVGDFASTDDAMAAVNVAG
jgi:hypothetical protein